MAKLRALAVLPVVLAILPLQAMPAAARMDVAKPSSIHAAAPSSRPQTSRVTAGFNNFGLSREVFGYAYLSSLGDPNVGYPSWNFDLLSTVAVFSIQVDYNGVLVADSNWTVWTSSTLNNLVAVAHQHGVKVVVTLTPAWHDATDFCDTLYNDDTTVLQIMNQVKQKGVDGVNIDFEGANYSCVNNNPALNASAQSLMTRFAKDMRAGLDSYRSGLYLSIASYSGSASDNTGFFNIPALNAYVDAFFVMTYDQDYANQGTAPLAACGGFCMGPISPWANYYWNDSNAAAQYTNIVGPGKFILGQPYYGRVACVSSPVPHAAAINGVQTPTYLGAAAAIASGDVKPGTYSINRDSDDPAGLDRWDAWYDTVYGCWREMYWSDTTTLGARYDYINVHNLSGVGIWTLSYGGGASELWNALWTHFVLCYNGSLTSTQASPVPAGSTIALTAGSNGCMSPEYEFWVQYPDGSWHLVRGWGGPTFNWNTTNLAPGTYTVHAWANRSGSSWETMGSETIVLTGCTSASLSPATTSAPAGTVVSLTETSSGGCPTPVYEFWVQYPDGSWNLKRGWDTSGAFNWDTSGLPPGVYTVHGWANAQGASPALETYGSSVITLTGCTSASLSPPSGSVPGGTVVSYTATSSGGCPTPVYEFWVQNPDGSWVLKQGWGAATFNWDTTAVPPGTYTIHAWANQQGAAPTLETYGTATLTVTGCGSASVTPATASQAAGTTVALSASATGCVNAQYEFWVQYPNGTWVLKRGWGAATFNWDTTGLGPGTYVVHAWVNRTGTGWDAIGTSTVTLTGCTSAAVAPPSGSSAVGTAVTFTTTANGCPTPVYEYWIQYPDGTWHLGRAFDVNGSWTWATTGLPKGKYVIHVWADNQGADMTSYETIGSATYTLT